MLGGLISAGASVVGGILGNSQADKDRKLQKQLAHEGIRLRVNDAKAAGIHPLYALGAPTLSASPVPVGDFGISQAGQDIGRAIDQTMNSDEKKDAVSGALLKLQMENQSLQNDTLRLELASKATRLRQQNQAPFPGGTTAIPGQGNATMTMSDGTKVPYDPKVTSAQDAEDRFGEIGGEVFGAPQLIRGFDAAFTKWARDTFGVDPRDLTPWALGKATQEYFSHNRRGAPMRGGGSGW